MNPDNILFFMLFIAISQGSTFNIQLPTNAVNTHYTEEIWIYLNKPLSIPSTNLYIFYQKNNVQLELANQDAILTLTLYGLNDEAKKETKALTNVIKPQCWVHLAVTEATTTTGIYMLLYANGIPSKEITADLPLTRVLFKIRE